MSWLILLTLVVLANGQTEVIDSTIVTDAPEAFDSTSATNAPDAFDSTSASNAPEINSTDAPIAYDSTSASGAPVTSVSFVSTNAPEVATLLTTNSSYAGILHILIVFVLFLILYVI